MLQTFAIRHIPTQSYMPKRKQEKGSSHWVPGIVDREHETDFPKLFHTEHAAICAVYSWLRGKVVMTAHQGHEDPYPEYTLDLRKDPTRRLKDLEIVTFDLVERKIKRSGVQPASTTVVQVAGSKVVVGVMGDTRFHGMLAHLNKDSKPHP